MAPDEPRGTRLDLAAPPDPTTDMVWIPGRTFAMGSDDHYPEEAPVHDVAVGGFWIDRLAVRNRDFERFVRATGHVTVAERAPDPADYPGALPDLLVPASSVFVAPGHVVDMRNAYNWWSYVPGANWRRPYGPGSSIRDRPDHPVVHLAWEDAEAYVLWAGKQIPTEAEWELAARGGLDGAPYAWGDEFVPDGVWMANTWQGRFPYENTAADGYVGTAPVGRYPPNGYGLYDMIGNVWEWTADWYVPHGNAVAACCGPTTRELSVEPGTRLPRKVIKGGSHLCAPNYCRRYRPAARMAQTIDTATNHIGLRCVVRPDREPGRPDESDRRAR